MLVCGALVGAAVAAVGWMLGISYVDYLVAQHRRFGGLSQSGARQQLALERFFAMPWNRVVWLASGGVVLALAFVGGLLGFGVLVLVSVVGVAVIGAIVLSDWQQLQSRQARPMAPSGVQVTGSAVPEAWLYGVRGEHVGHDFRLNSHGLTIGRSADNTLRLRERSVSRHHALISFGRGRWFLQDQGSAAGTFVNRHRVKATALNNGDRVQIGSEEFEFCLQRPEGSVGAVAWLRGTSGEHAGRVFQLDSRGLRIGRGASNTVSLADREVSRRHALICFEQGRWLLQDQASADGTFVNGQRVRATALKHGDRIRIGPAEFEFRLHR
jgi:pSer/pThr/pTyr-binding forkhead associated (FHA) protein